MPHQSCTVCRHPQRESIDLALRTNSGSLRVLAGRFGVSKTALDRHHHHADHKRDRKNTEQIAGIDAEIGKLIRAQNRAKRKRDNVGALAIARELRAWYVLKAKAAAVVSASQPEQTQEISHAEALGLAKAIIEAEATAGSSEIVAWLQGLCERVRPADAVPAEEIVSVNGSEKLPENRDTTGTVEIEHV